MFRSTQEIKVYYFMFTIFRSKRIYSMQAVAVASYVHLDPIPLQKVLGRALEHQCKFPVYCDLGLLTLSCADAKSPFLTFLGLPEYCRGNECRHVLSMRRGDLLEHRWCIASADSKIFGMDTCSHPYEPFHIVSLADWLHSSGSSDCT